jgi:hypothetical protein
MEAAMNAIQQIVQIPADRRLQLDLTIPEDIPMGEAEIHVVFTSLRKDAPPRKASNRLGFMRGQGVAPEDIKSVGREEIIAMFEGRE